MFEEKLTAVWIVSAIIVHTDGAIIQLPLGLDVCRYARRNLGPRGLAVCVGREQRRGLPHLGEIVDRSVYWSVVVWVALDLGVCDI